MIGQDAGKQGNLYEEAYVILQLLRLLNEEVDSVTWEARGDDGLGIDCWLQEAETRVGVQCKTRTTGNWTLKRLAEKRVLATPVAP